MNRSIMFVAGGLRRCLPGKASTAVASKKPFSSTSRAEGASSEAEGASSESSSLRSLKRGRRSEVVEAILRLLLGSRFEDLVQHLVHPILVGGRRRSQIRRKRPEATEVSPCNWFHFRPTPERFRDESDRAALAVAEAGGIASAFVCWRMEPTEARCMQFPRPVYRRVHGAFGIYGSIQRLISQLHS